MNGDFLSGGVRAVVSWWPSRQGVSFGPKRFISWALIPGGLIHHFNLLQVVFICCRASSYHQMCVAVFGGGERRLFLGFPTQKLFHLFTFITCKLSTYCRLQANRHRSGTRSRQNQEKQKRKEELTRKFLPSWGKKFILLLAQRVSGLLWGFTEILLPPPYTSIFLPWLPCSLVYI